MSDKILIVVKNGEILGSTRTFSGAYDIIALQAQADIAKSISEDSDMLIKNVSFDFDENFYHMLERKMTKLAKGYLVEFDIGENYYSYTLVEQVVA